MPELIKEIAKADADELEVLLRAVLERYAILFPDWEITTVSFRKSGDKNAQIDQFINMLMRMKTPPLDG